MTTQAMPKKLGKSPLLEAIFEIRFAATIVAAGDVLPGLLYKKLSSEYSEVQPLPMANVPRQLRDQEAKLMYQASHRLVSSTSGAVQVGDRVVSLVISNYPGWTVYRKKIEELLAEVKETGLVKNVERCSFRYINLIAASGDQAQLPLIDTKIAIAGRAPVERGLHIRAEIDEGGFTTVVQISPNATATLSMRPPVQGLLLDLDTIKSDLTQDFLVSPGELLLSGHKVIKRLFFSLITRNTLDRFEPEW